MSTSLPLPWTSPCNWAVQSPSGAWLVGRAAAGGVAWSREPVQARRWAHRASAEGAAARFGGEVRDLGATTGAEGQLVLVNGPRVLVEAS